MKKKQRPWGERFFRRFFYKYYSQNLLYELQIRARNEAVDYIQENMSDAMIWETQIDIMRHGISSSDINGFGIWCCHWEIDKLDFKFGLKKRGSFRI